MRFLAFAILAFLASGCTIHVVEQPATPTTLAEAPRPARVRSARPRPSVHVPSVYVPVAADGDRGPRSRPTPVAPVAPVATPAPAARPTPLAMASPIAAPPHRERPQVTKPPRRPFRIVFKTLPPETRSPRLVNATPPRKHHRPHTVKQDQATELVSSTHVAKAQ
jgi:hypothetical protein